MIDGLEQLPRDLCIAPGEQTGEVCQNETACVDEFGLPWCRDHLYRRDFLAWGKAHGWPELEMEPYRVAAGMYHWYVAATLAREEMIWLLVGAIEMLETQSA